MLINGSDNVVTKSTAVYDEAQRGRRLAVRLPDPDRARAPQHGAAAGRLDGHGGRRRRPPAARGSVRLRPAGPPGELWDPVAKTWKLGAEQLEGRAYHSTALLIPDGRVVSAGDDYNGPGGADTGWNTDTAEFYSPPYLFKGPRPTITGAPAGVAYNAQFAVDTPDTDVTKAAMVGLGATTHANDMNQRYVPLALAPRSGGVTLTSPPNDKVAPPGYYMLFLLNANGVPSIARMVQVGGAGNPQPPPDSTPPAKPATPTATPATPPPRSTSRR